MAKRNKDADKTYNARRRFARAAVRNLDKAEKASGATAARYRQLARSNYESALALYGEKMPARKSKELRRLESEFGFDIEQIDSDNREVYIAKSYSTLESSLADVNIRREEEARTLLNDSVIGPRILGGLVDVWKDAATVTDDSGLSKVDNKKRVPALLDYFKVNSLADMIDKLEESIGSSLYDLKGNAENIYEYVKILIQTKVVSNELVE